GTSPTLLQAWLRRILEVATVARPWETCGLGVPLGQSELALPPRFCKRGYGEFLTAQARPSAFILQFSFVIFQLQIQS
ncbi:MAG: hypothetical protein WD045_03785, partial [Pirellulaceae bacterium]